MSAGSFRRGRRLLPVGAVTAVAVTAIWSIGQRVVYEGKVLPGTEVLGVSLGGADRQEARRRLTRASVDDRVATMVVAGERLTVRAADIGFRVDAGASVQRALAAGRDGPLEGLGSALTAWIAPRQLEPVYTVDGAALRRRVAEAGDRFGRPAFLGGLDIDPASLRVEVVAPRQGRSFDRAAAAEVILDALRQGGDSAPAPVDVIRAPTRTAVEAIAQEAREYLSEPIRFFSPRRVLVVGRRRLAGVLDVVRFGPAGGVRLGTVAAAVDDLTDDLARRADRPASDATISTAVAPVTLEDKLDLTWRPRRATSVVRPSRAGRVLDRAATAIAVEAAIPERRHAIPLPLRRTRPDVTTLDARKVENLIGTFTTRFVCCEPRVTNIRTMAASVDGTLIPAGGRFSLNEVAGERTRAKGYLPAPFIADGEIVPSVGGGVSQFSTTLYNAAFFAGLRLDTHQPHSIYIDRYPPGREATLDFASIDLVFTNDTDAPVLVRAASTGTSVTVSLFGDNGGPRVSAESGPRDVIAGGGFSLTVTRVIRSPGRRTVREPFTTTYDAPPAVE